MTSPDLARTTKGGRMYRMPGADSYDYVSVTTVLSRGKPKALNNWLKKITAEYAVDNRERWAKLDRDDAVELIKAETDRIRDSAAHRGDEAHAYLEQRLLGQHPDIRLFHPDAHPYIEQVERFIGEWGPTAILVEKTVFSHHGYAGSFDAIVDLPGLGRILLDAKTSARVYDDVALQLAAYRYAGHYAQDHNDPNLKPLPEVDGCAVLHLQPDSYDIVPVVAEREQHDTFLACMAVADYGINGWKHVIRRPATPPRDLTAELEASLRRRIPALSPEARAWVAAHWPTGVPTLKQGGLTAAQMCEIDRTVAVAEAAEGQPFDPPPAPERLRTTIAELANADPGDTATEHLVDRMRSRLQRLPSDLLAAVTAEAKRAGIPNLNIGPVTLDHLDQLDWTASLAEREHNERCSQLVAALSPLEVEIENAIMAVVGVAGRSYMTLTDLEADTVCALADPDVLAAISAAHIDDTGALVLQADTERATARLVELHGSKTAVLTQAKALAVRLDRPAPRSTAAVAADLTLTALLAVGV